LTIQLAKRHETKNQQQKSSANPWADTSTRSTLLSQYDDQIPMQVAFPEPRRQKAHPERNHACYCSFRTIIGSIRSSDRSSWLGEQATNTPKAPPLPEAHLLQTRSRVQADEHRRSDSRPLFALRQHQ
jgi:hypothetical protein